MNKREAQREANRQEASMMNEDLRAYRLEKGVTLQEVADELGRYGPSWVWKRERGEVSLTPAEDRLIQAAIDRVVERKQTRKR